MKNNLEKALTQERKGLGLRRIYTIELELIPGLKGDKTPTDKITSQGLQGSEKAAGGENERFAEEVKIIRALGLMERTPPPLATPHRHRRTPPPPATPPKRSPPLKNPLKMSLE